MRCGVCRHEGKAVRSRTARLTLVDLAGAECASDTNGTAINVSLLFLQRVIRARAEGSAHVPYRDSALTRLLEGGLRGDGNAATLIACVSPAKSEEPMTAGTVGFAERSLDVRMASVRAAETLDVASDDPMADDERDTDDGLDRRSIKVPSNVPSNVLCNVPSNVPSNVLCNRSSRPASLNATCSRGASAMPRHR